MTRIAFLGLGAMGSRMAHRFLAAGHELVVWNRTASKSSRLVHSGARAAGTPADAVRDAEVVMTMLADPEALADVVEGPDGVAQAIRGDAVVVEMSTVGPAAIRRMREALPDGVALIDAPVLGSLSEVEEGNLRVFMGGPDDVVERCAPLLAVLGDTLHVGPLGSGAAAKLVANSTLLGVLGVLGEALALGDRLGLPRDRTFEVLEASPLGAQAKRRRPAVESGDYPLRFSLELALKDAELVMGASDEVGADLRVAAAARSWFAAAVAAGWGERDYSSVLAFISGR